MIPGSASCLSLFVPTHRLLAVKWTYRFFFAVVLASFPSVAFGGFVETANSVGITAVHSQSTDQVPKGQAGIAAVDVNGDGWTDLLAANRGRPPSLYINRDGTFTDEVGTRGLLGAVDASAFGAGDFDNDGDQDLLVVPLQGNRFYLYINNGAGQFTEEAAARGALVQTAAQDHLSYSVGIVDYDRDGYLDLYVSEWGVGSVLTERTLHSVLLRNVGASAPGNFVNATGPANITQPTPPHETQFGFSTAWGDFDGDGWPDVYLVQDFHQSKMFWNNGNGTFTESTAASGLGLDFYGMGVAVDDYDHDGLLDIMVSSIADRNLPGPTGNRLYRNRGGRVFEEVSEAAGVHRTGWGWGVAFFDFDNDSTRDIIVTNGQDDVQVSPNTPFWDATTDRTTLLKNSGTGVFTDVSEANGIRDTRLGKGLVVLDYDNDGDEDVVIANTRGKALVYTNDASVNGNKWLRLKLRGTISNRDGIGAIARVTSGGKTQTRLFNPSNAYLGQREAVLHFGLGGADAAVSAVQITWPSGIVQDLGALATNTVHSITEAANLAVAPIITTDLTGGTFTKGQDVVLSVAVSGSPAPAFRWEKDGVAVAGATGATLRLKSIHPFDAGTYRVIASNIVGNATSSNVTVAVTIDLPKHSVARWWNEFLLDGIRKDTPNPPVHGRNLFHLSAAMWDAFWPYKEEGWTRALPIFVKEEVLAADWTGGREAAQNQAISHAAYRIITERFKNSPGKARTLFGCRWLMQQLGYDPDFTGTTGSSPAAVGNRIGYGVLAATLNDGANEANRYVDATGYVAANTPLIVELDTITMSNPSQWQPLSLKFSITQNGLPQPAGPQGFVGVNARNTRPFALAKPTPTTIALDPGPPPEFGGATHAEFVQEAVDAITMSSWLDTSDGQTIDISPGAYLNNPLGSNDGTGRPLNPITGQPYAPNVVKRGDYARVLTEYWADGPSSETPPGHWNVVFNDVTDTPSFSRRYGGVGSVLSPLEWDVRGYLSLNGAMHDAACAAWTLKRQYNSARPISMVRYLASLGQSSDPAGVAYNPNGLPLISNLIEVVTVASSAPGQRHAALAASVGKIAIRAWQGNPLDPKTQTGGVGWILAEQWVPYQLPTFVSPAFPGYVSGHSTFSRAAAEMLTLLTGSPFFPGGLGEYRLHQNEFLTVERGPTTDVTLQWATYYDAADQAGLSRLFGGIHPSVDDFKGRRLGSRVGLNAFLEAQRLRNAAAVSPGLVNLSSRGRSGAGDDVMIAGFVLEGTTPEPALLRALGPQLEKNGISRAQCEADPRFDVYRINDDAAVLSNDNWGSSPRLSQIVALAAERGAPSLTTGSTDAADIVSLPNGVYTMVMRSAAPEARGVALAEIFSDRLINLSTRGRVGAGNDVVIAGFVIDEKEPMPVLVRAIGPTLSAFGVSNPLPNPVLTVYRHPASGPAVPVASNDDWSTDAKASLALGATLHVGAAPLTHGTQDAALFLQLPPGVYTAVVSSADATEGVAVVEVFHVK